MPTGRRKKQPGKEFLSFEHNKGCIYVHRETLECFLFVWKHRWFWWKWKQSFHWNFLLKRGTPSREYIFLFLFCPNYQNITTICIITLVPWLLDEIHGLFAKKLLISAVPLAEISDPFSIQTEALCDLLFSSL